jgi:hypothetical protein
MQFERPNTFALIVVDRNACEPDRWGTYVSPGTFALGDSCSLVTSFRDRDGILQANRSSVAVVPGPALGEPEHLMTGVFVSVDERTFRSESALRWENVDTLSFGDTELTVIVAFDSPLPANGAGTCRMTVSVEASNASGYGDGGATSSFSDRWAQACTYEPWEGRLRIVFGAVDPSEPRTAEVPLWLSDRLIGVFSQQLVTTTTTPPGLSKAIGWERSGPPPGL